MADVKPPSGQRILAPAGANAGIKMPAQLAHQGACPSSPDFDRRLRPGRSRTPAVAAPVVSDAESAVANVLPLIRGSMRGALRTQAGAAVIITQAAP